MNRKILLTNCPNCGGTLTESGDCPYCKTKVRFENELNISTGDEDVPERVEILIKRTCGNTVNIIPFEGYLERVETYDYVDPVYVEYNGKRDLISLDRTVDMSLTFRGSVIDMK